MDHPFRTSVIQPFDCIQEGWRRIRDAYGLFLGITLVGLLLGGMVPFGILLGPMMCGMSLCFLDKGRGLPVRFETLFKGFDHFQESLIASLVLFGISLLAALPFTFLMFGTVLVGVLGPLSGRPAGPFLVGAGILGCGSLLLLVMVSMILGAIVAFTFPLIVDRKLKGLEAIRLGAKAARANWQGMLGLSALTGLISLAGLCCCYLGIFLVAPVTLSASIIAYEQVFGWSESETKSEGSSGTHPPPDPNRLSLPSNPDL